jgi:hypothetical protein
MHEALGVTDAGPKRLQALTKPTFPHRNQLLLSGRTFTFEQAHKNGRGSPAILMKFILHSVLNSQM